jgi:gluconolactonase
MTDSWTILAAGLAFPEGPAFAPDGSLWCVELQGGTLVHRACDDIVRICVGGEPNGLAFTGSTPVFCDAGRNCISQIGPTGDWMPFISSEELLFDRPNDLAIDRSGNLVFTCPGNSRTEPTGAVWCRSHSGTLQCVANGLYFPNGLAFSPDGCELVVAETYRQRLWRGRWDSSSGCWLDAKPWVEVSAPIGPDGLAFSADGKLYVAAFGAGKIIVFDQAGHTVDHISVPGSRPTNVALDPAGRLGLIVTEAEHGLLLSYPAIADRPALFGVET